MSLLPWLLDWPPSRGAVAAFLVVTAFSVGSLAVFGGVVDDAETENVTVESTDLALRLNDEFDPPDTNGSVQTCVASGTPGDTVSLVGSVTVDAPSDRRGGLEVVLNLPGTDESRTTTVEADGGTVDVFWLFDDDETLEAGDDATLRVTVRSGGEILLETTRPLTVEADSRSYDC